MNYTISEKVIVFVIVFTSIIVIFTNITIIITKMIIITKVMIIIIIIITKSIITSSNLTVCSARLKTIGGPSVTVAPWQQNVTMIPPQRGGYKWVNYSPKR